MEQCTRTASIEAVTGLGLNGMVNESESSLNVVSYNKPKDADRLAPKGEWSGAKVSQSFVVDVEPPAKRRDLTHSGIYAERGNPVIFLERGKQAVRRTDKVAGIGYGRKRTPFL